jgi:hypothetical protein
MAKKIKGPSVTGADGRTYMNPAYYGFPDPQGNAARILDRIQQIKVRKDLFSREAAGKREKIKELQREENRARVDAYVTGGDFPDISEVAALESDIEELEGRVRAARNATEVLAGELNMVQMENRDGYIEVLKKREQEIMDRYFELEQAAQQVIADWRGHAMMVEGITGERQSLDFVHPSKPILLRDPDDVVIGTWTAAGIT